MQCPPGMQQFQEPAAGISGYIGNFMVTNANSLEPKVVGIEGFSFSVMDEVKVPEHFEEGEYLLSWRWDCEQSPQIWQQCADIRLVKVCLHNTCQRPRAAIRAASFDLAFLSSSLSY